MFLLFYFVFPHPYLHMFNDVDDVG